MAKLDEYEQDIVNNVEEHGWMGIYVFDPDGKAPDFTYTIGFHKTLNCPDFIIFGLPNELMHSMLWTVFREIKAGKKPEDRTTWEGLLDGDFICESRLVHPDNHASNYFNSSRWFHHYDGGDVSQMRFMQLFWPGSQNKLFPWDKDCGDYLIENQPLLFEPGHDYE